MSERGLVISCPALVQGTKLSVGGDLDAQELRSSLLFWDKLDFPDNDLISFGHGPNVDYLISAGVLNRTRVVGSGKFDATVVHTVHLHAFRTLDEREPWSVGP